MVVEMACPTAQATLTLLPDVEKPRRTLMRGYRPHIVIGPTTQRTAAPTEHYQSVVFLDEFIEIAPGETKQVSLGLWAYPDNKYADVIPGATFTLREGPTIIGYGTINSRTDDLIRPAHASEATALSELALRSKAHWGYSSEFLEAVRAELSYDEKQLRSERMRFFVLESAGRPVGFYALEHRSGPEVELDSLFVEPEHIGKGFGRSLIEHAKSVAATMGAAKLIIQGDPYAERFYLAAGAIRTGTRESGSIPGRFLPTFAIHLR